MNILMIMFLPLVAHGDAPCPQLSVHSTEIQMVAANRHDANRYAANVHDLIETGVIGADKGGRGTRVETVARAELEDLLFYFSSHAQAVGDSSGATMTPWLELRPIGYVEQGVLTGTSEPAPVGDDRACSRSAAHAPASAPALLSGDV